MKKILVLGSGLVGRAISLDLARKYKVTATDIDINRLKDFNNSPNINTLQLDVTDKAKLAEAVNNYDLIVSAVPGFLGFETMKNIISTGKDLVDISFMPEDVLALDDAAKKNNSTVIMDTGVAPGLPNYILGYYNESMQIQSAEYYVGGLPKERIYPFEYKAPFSPADVIEEYTRPARFIENGELIVKPAMSDAEIMDLPKAGRLEAFNTDGLRSLVKTMGHIPHLKEKTLRYPGHIELIKVLMSAGFFSREKVKVNGAETAPYDVTIKLLFDNWKLNEDDEEFTVLQVILNGVKDGKQTTIVYDLYDEYDKPTGISSMARTTGYTATAAAELILEEKFTQKGVFPPELVGKYPECFNFIIEYLKERNINFTVTLQ
jgi:saccharopine dehydrogenase-like NADP-dependent oxidoreductase